MKFAQRISSIRRIASNAWRRCSPASASMWPASEASSALAGWIVSPRAASSDVTGSWASHSTTSPGTRRRSSSAIRTSRHACPSPIGDETTSARRGCEAGRAHRAGIRGPHATSRRRRFTPTGSRTSARCPEPSRTTSRPPVSSATRAPRSGGTISSAVPWTTTTGQRTARHSASAASRSATPCSPRVMARISGVVSSPHATPSSSAFVECGSGSAWVKKNSRKPRKSCCQYSGVSLAQPRSRHAGSSVRWGTAGPSATTDRTRSGCSAASSSA